MQAYVIEAPGGAEALLRREIPRPAPRDGWVLIHVRAFGLNRSEWFTRRGDSPNVRFPRVLGIECVGEVVSAPGTDLEEGQRVAAMMGGMGREFDGSYAATGRGSCSMSSEMNSVVSSSTRSSDSSATVSSFGCSSIRTGYRRSRSGSPSSW